MRYIGGKSRIAKELVPFIQAALKRSRSFQLIEPFCGGLGMTCAVAEALPLVKVTSSDVAPGLIPLYLHVRSGWKPPRYMPRDAWERLKQRAGEPDPLVAFAGFGCSFNGSYFSAYGMPEFARQAADGLERKLAICKRVEFLARPYQDIQVDGPCVVYCDPPYADTDPGSYRSLRNTPHQHFDSEAFWVWAREQAAKGAHVLVSEYTGPSDARVVWQRSVTSTVAAPTGACTAAVERLFYLEGAR